MTCMIYDGNDKYSFGFLVEVQKKIYSRKLPCLYVKTKDDLKEANFSDEITPTDFLEEFKLVEPFSCSVKKRPEELNDIHKNFLEAAINYKLFIPYIQTVEKVGIAKILKRTFTLAGVFGILGYAGYSLWKYFKGEKNK